MEEVSGNFDLWAKKLNSLQVAYEALRLSDEARLVF